MTLRWHTLAFALVGAGAFASAQDAPPASSDPQSFPAVVARVNGTEISKDALVRRAEAIRQQVPPAESGAGFYQRVLDDMVSGELLFQIVEREGLLPTDADVDAEIQNQTQRFGGADAFEAMLQQQGLTLVEVKTDIKKELGIQRLVQRDFAPKVAVSDAEKRTFYDENTDSMQKPAEYRAAHILISVDENATPDAKAELETKARSIRGMIEMGQDFGELAAKNSGDPGSKNNGGELPWMSEGQTVPPFEAAMKSLEPGQMSGVVETQFGFHIIKLLEKKAGGAVPYEEVEVRIEEFLKQRGLQEQLRQEIETLRGTAAIEVFI